MNIILIPLMLTSLNTYGQFIAFKGHDPSLTGRDNHDGRDEHIPRNQAKDYDTDSEFEEYLKNIDEKLGNIERLLDHGKTNGRMLCFYLR